MSPTEASGIIHKHIAELSRDFEAIQIIAKLPDGTVHVGRKGGKIKLGTAEKFWARVDKTGGQDSCWPFSGGYKAKGGHGAMGIRNGHGQVAIGTRGKSKNGTILGAHRLAWILTNGEIPNGLCVCHHCDNPPCCNPRHLFLGSHVENMKDMHRKGRASGGSQKGESNRNSRLTSDQVLDIRQKCNSGMLQREIAEIYGIGQTTVSYVISQGWKHL